MNNQLNLFEIKECSRCKEFKPPSDFNKNKTTRDGLSCACRDCLKMDQKKKYTTDAEYRNKVIQAGKNYYKLNKPKRKREGPSELLRSRIVEIFRYPSTQTCDTIGCTGVEFHKYIVSKLLKGMEPKDINKTWKFDFYKPLTSFDFTKMEERRKAFHHTNIFPIWKNSYFESINK